MIRGYFYRRTEKQSFYIIAPVELYGQSRQFVRLERRPREIIAAPVDTVFAVIDTLIGKQYLQQGNAPAIRTPGMADPRRMGVADISRILPVGSTAGTGHVVLGTVCQYLKFFHKSLHFHPLHSKAASLGLRPRLL